MSKAYKVAAELRSWVPLPPGPFLPVIELRQCFELDFNNCQTKPSAAMPMPYPSAYGEHAKEN